MIKLIYTLTALIFLGACATTPPVPREVQIKERAEKRWQHLIKGELVPAYELISPAMRLAYTKETYQTDVRLGQWSKAEVRGVKCEEATMCQVEVGVTVRIRMRGAGVRNHESTTTELWRLVDGQWWFVPVTAIPNIIKATEGKK